MKIIIGPDPANPAPPELANYVTVQATDGPPVSNPKPRDTNGDSIKKPRSIADRFGKTTSQQDAVWHDMETWLSSNPDEADDYRKWWDDVGKKARQMLRDWIRDHMKPEDERPPKPPDTAPVGDKEHKPHNRPKHPGRKGRPAKHPAYTIQESASQAAIWLAERWPDRVREVGYAVFVVDRYKEILAGQFTDPYWEPLSRRDPQAAVTFATGTLNPNWAKPPFNDPTRKRTITRYAQTGTPYDLPTPGTEGAQPYPGFKGGLTGDELHDNYLAYWIENFDFPWPYEIDDMPPVFFNGRSNHHLIADKPPSKVQLGTYTLPIIYSDNPAAAWPPAALPHYGRRYNWTRKIPPGGAINYAATMTRHWILDCRVLAMLNGNSDNRAEKLQLHFAPLAAMGRYYGKASQVKTIYSFDEAAAYVARTPEDPITWYPTFLGFTAGMGWTAKDIGKFPPTMGTKCLIQAFDPTGYNVTPPINISRVTVLGLENGAFYNVGPPNYPPIWQVINDNGPEYQPNNEIGQAETLNRLNLRDFGKNGGQDGYCLLWCDRTGQWRSAPMRPSYMPGGESTGDFWNRYHGRGGIDPK